MIDPHTPDHELLELFLGDDLSEEDAARVSGALEHYPAWRDALEHIQRNRKLQERLRSAASNTLGTHVPLSIPGFDILHEIHRGGQGVVYTARQHSTGRRVALKLLLQGRFATPMQRRRFEREIDLAASLDHPNIVKVFDRSETPGGEPYYIMELVEGLPLDTFLRNHRITTHDRLELFKRISTAVSYAHQRAVIHRDLKPANILIDERHEPRILDFGLAKPTDLAATESIVTEAGGFVGTLRYASPEQLQAQEGEDRSTQAPDVRTDVYSLSVILFEMLTDQSPYAEASPLSALLRSITTADPIRPRSIVRSLDPDLETIILKGLEKTPDRRYQAASELSADIERFLSGQPISARPPSASYQLRKLAQRNKPLFAAAMTSLTVLIVALVAVTAALIQTSRSRDAAQRRFDQVHTLARTFIYDIHDDIADLPGATKARQHLVDTALEYVDSLANDATHDRELLLDLAEAYDRIGDVQGNPDYANLGDMPGALASYTKSLEIRARLVETDPTELNARRALAHSREHIGDISMHMGETANGVASFRSALEVFQSIAQSAQSPFRDEVQRDVGALQMKLGRALIVVGEDDNARDAISASLRTRRELVELAPERADYQRELSQSHISLGDEFRYARHLEGALAEYRAAETIRTTLVSKQPGNSTALRDLGIVHNRIGNVLVDQKSFDDAFESFGQYHSICKTLAEADPENAEAQRDLSVSLEKLAKIRHERGQPDDAIPFFDECIGVRATLVAQYAENPRFIQDLSIALQLRGNSHLAARRIITARTDYERALQLRLPLFEQDPDNARLKNLVMAAHYKIAESHVAEAKDASRPATERVDSFRSARGEFEQALDIIRQMQQNQTLPPSSHGLPDQIVAAIEECSAAITESQ